MHFDSNRAWQEAVATVSANRDVLLPVAGVFLLLPSVLGAFFLGDLQTEMMKHLGDADALNRLMEGKLGLVLGVGLFSALTQFIGVIAMLMLLTDRARPTVGEAISAALAALPTMIGVLAIMWLGMVVLALLLGLVSALLATLFPPGLALFLMALIALAAMVYVAVKLSLVAPVVAIEGVRNPFVAISRSWKLTKGNSLRIFAFYALLFFANLVISMLILMVVGGVLTLLGSGTLLTFMSSVVSGAVGAVITVLLTAVVAAIHRQLAGPSLEAISSPFE